MSNELIKLIKNGKIIAQKSRYSAVYDSYNSDIISSDVLLELLQDENCLIIKDGHYTISKQTDKTKVYDRYGNAIKEVQSILYTANIV